MILYVFLSITVTHFCMYILHSVRSSKKFPRAISLSVTEPDGRDCF